VRKNGKLTPATWEEAFELIGKRFREIRDRDGGSAIGVIGSNRTTNEENYLLSKFARVVLQTNNVDHHRTADFPALAAALHGRPGRTASMRDVLSAPAILLIGNDPSNQHPLLAWQIRTNVRLRRAKLYVINSAPIKLRRQAAGFGLLPAGTEAKAVAFLDGDEFLYDSLVNDVTNRDAWIALRDKLRAEQNMVIAFSSELRGQDIKILVSFASMLPGAKLICLGDYANSRGASDMGLYPDLLPGYAPVTNADRFQQEWGKLPTEQGLSLLEMVEAAKVGNLKALYVVGSNPVGRLGIDPFVLSKSFVVVQDMFLTETATIASVVLPAANAYEKTGTYTNTCGDLQLLKKAGEVSNTKPDFEMIVRIADAMGFDVRALVPFGSGTQADMGQTRGAQSGEADRHAVWLEACNLQPKMTPFDPMAILDEIQRVVAGYDFSRVNLLAGNDQHIDIADSGTSAIQNSQLIVPANDNLFSSGTLGKYSKTLNSVFESKSTDSDVAAD
jgi:NADH-quinone oxidoreductase subunit G